MKRFIAFVAFAVLCAAPATAQEFVEGPTATILFQSGVVEIDTDGDCISVRGDGDALGDTCGTDLVTELFFPTDVFVTSFGTALYFAGDVASYECDFQLKIGGTAVGTKLQQDTATVIGTVNTSVAQNLKVAAGTALEVVVTDGGSGCAGAIDPKYTVTLYGYPVN
ncbi:MAG: hypothetical protein ACYS7Y_32845 [Planctomycetota bacterium]|jgi:hypothetical protein